MAGFFVRFLKKLSCLVAKGKAYAIRIQANDPDDMKASILVDSKLCYQNYKNQLKVIPKKSQKGGVTETSIKTIADTIQSAYT